MGAPAPGEVYIFGVARRHRAVTAALRGWYLESLSWSGFGGRDKTWKDRFARIKQVAAWESKVAAQYVSAADRAAREALRFLELAGLSKEQASEALPAVVELASAAMMGLDKAAQIAGAGARLLGDTLTAAVEAAQIAGAAAAARDLRSGAVLTGTLEITSPGTWFDESEPMTEEAWFNAERNPPPGLPGVLSYPRPISSRIDPEALATAPQRVRDERRAASKPAPKPRKRDKRGPRHTQRRR